MKLVYRLPPEMGGRKLQSVLRGDMKISASLVRRLKAAGGIFVDGNPQYTNFILSGGEEITADISAAEPDCDIVPQPGPLEILYEDEGILALNKDSGTLTHPSRAQYMDTLSNYAAFYLEKEYGDYRCHSVNRLDRGTSGAVLFSKNAYFMDRCAYALGRPDAFKEYTAVCIGHFAEKEGTIDLPIFRPDSRDIIRTVDGRGQRAVTHFKAVFEGEVLGEAVSVVQLRLETGRTHQIRVHLNHIGHPILGDNMYFSPLSKEISQKLDMFSQALHAGKMGFTHPLSGSFITIAAPVNRDDMKNVLSRIGYSV